MTGSEEPLRSKLLIKQFPVEQLMKFHYLRVETTCWEDFVNDARQQRVKHSLRECNI